jgi:cell division protein FtsI (penicillin-binding protein 3)
MIVEERKKILSRIYLVYILCCVFGLAIISRVFFLQFVKGDQLRKAADTLTIRQIDIEAVRGNIFDKDSFLLATSLPYYEVGVDPHANAFIDDQEFNDSALALSKGLSNIFPENSSDSYYRMLVNARDKGLRYQLIARNVSDAELKEMQKLPLFRAGRFKGGFIYVQENHRERPFRTLAARTIGYIGDSGRVRVGLEGAFDSVLTGTSGKALMRKIAGGVWMPIDNENEIEPQKGKDIVTTLDINLQDVAENSLMNSLIAHGAKYGCVVLMEVSTGEVRAIANLTRVDSLNYVEDYNYAIGDAREPGSTFKLASLLVGMDDGLIDPDDRIDLEGGRHTYGDLVMHDAETPAEDNVTVAQAFWESSNVGISKAITNAYGKDPKKFTDGLHRLSFGMQLGISIHGEGTAMIKNAGGKDWTGVSLPYVSIGYESLITPLQTLSLYNAVANNGTMVRPMFVKAIKEKGKVIQTFAPEIINPAIAKPETIKKARKLLEGVVQNGTARNLNTSVYPIAGKTGTAQIAKGHGYGKDKNSVTYQASFVGYFPADKPKYSCIVVVNAPSGDVYYGGKVAGPIFKAIADRVYSTEPDVHDAVNAHRNSTQEIPVIKSGFSHETFVAAQGLLLDLGAEQPGTEFLRAKSDSTRITITSSDPDSELRSGIMPDLHGMAGSDALFLLENRGYRVILKGCGSVKDQSVSKGEKIQRGEEITIELSL